MKHLAFALAALLPAFAAAPDIEKGKIYGSPTAPIRIEIYSDFQCPACKNLHDTILPSLLKEYVTPGKVYIVSREFPLQMHPYAREAAHYATAAARIGIYAPVADRLFLTQQAWATNGKVWDNLVPILSADQQKKIQTGAKDAAVTTAVQEDVNLGTRERVQSTPTMFYIRGSKKFAIPYPVNYTFLKSLLDGNVK
jgi:protein-disulfide isomerase